MFFQLQHLATWRDDDSLSKPSLYVLLDQQPDIDISITHHHATDTTNALKKPPQTVCVSLKLSVFCLVAILLLLCITITTNNDARSYLLNKNNDQCVDSCCIFCNSAMSNMIQSYNYWGDSKYFVDMPLKEHPSILMQLFNQQIIDNTTLQNNATLQKQAVYNFVTTYFDEPGSDITECTPIDYNTDDNKLPSSLSKRIKDTKLLQFAETIYPLWKYLCRTVNPEVYAQPERHSLLGMPHAQMMISGGRFREIYYWDSYWIMKGLLVCDMHQSARQTLENIMWLSTLYGHTMNGNRIYYQNRSQPPLLASMMNLIYEYEGNNDSFIVHNKEFLHILKQDYLWWMDQQSLTIKRNNREYTVNRYYVDSDEPRPEGYVEDTALVSLLKNESLAAKKKAYSAVKAGAEAGWDFSSRWCLHQFCDKDMVNIDTLNVIPVELNAFFYRIEYLLYKFFKLVGEQQEARYFKQAMLNRSRVFAEFLWDNDSKIWRDWNVKEHKLVNQTTISNYLPLWVLPYNATLANMTLNHLNTSGLIRWGGVATTLTNDTQQWDLPDSWPPLQYLVAEMCQRYREELVIARQIEQNVTQTFVSAAFIGWYESGYMHEKYNVLELGASGVYGEYTPQTGFGWTNGVAFSFLHDYGNVLTAPQQSEDEPVDD